MEEPKLILFYLIVMMAVATTEADYETITKRADIVISAANRLNLITARSIKNGAIVIDAGNNACVVDGAKSVVVGDVAVLDTDDDYDDSGKRVSGSVGNVASCVVPMPGGLGPVTVSLLMRNTLDAYIRSRYPDRDFNLRTRQLIRCNK